MKTSMRLMVLLIVRRYLTLAIASAAIASAASSPTAAAPPKQLQGKSIVVSWSETRQQREETPGGGWSEFRAIQASHKLTIYVSTAGRVFSRQVNTTGVGSATTDQVAGQGNGPYTIRAPSFSGQTMTVIGVSRGGARFIQITFDSAFASCTARSAMGFEANKTRIGLSPITKRKVEIRSVSVGAAECSMQSGNVFGSSS